MAKAYQLTRRIAASTAGSCLRRLITVRLAEIEAYRPGVIEGTVDAVHDKRVACRRLQALFKVFRGQFHRKRAKTIIRPLSALIKALGAVREYDVLMGHLAEYVQPATKSQKMAFGLLVGRYALLRSRAHRGLVQELKVIRETPEQIERLTISAARQGESFLALVAQTVPSLFDEFVSSSSPVVDHPRSTKALHRFRIMGKPLRYVMELSASWYGPRYRACYGEVKAAIELLGSIHDIDVAMASLRNYREEIRFVNTASGPSPATVVPVAFLRVAIKTLAGKRAALFEELNTTVKRWRKERFGDALRAALLSR